MIYREEFSKTNTEVIEKKFEIGDVCSIHFRLIEGAFEHFFVIVKDSKKQIRALLTYKTRLKEYCLTSSLQTSDNNTVPGVLWKGTWTMEIVRTYPVKGGFTLAVDVDQGIHHKDGQDCLKLDKEAVKDEREGWYQGDFHMHSAYSDGRVTHEEIIAAANRKYLDFIALSDHSTVTTKFPYGGCMLIPSTEITWDNEGHYNIHGLTALPDYAQYVKTTSSKSAALDRLFQDHAKQGHLLTMNHPFPYGWEMQHSYDIRSLQTIEVMNAPHLLNEEIDNEKAVRFFDFLWNHGYYIFGIGGSDAHKKNYYDTYPIAIPMTKIYCKGLSIQNVLSGAKKGNSYMQVNEDFEIAYSGLDDAKKVILPGQRICGSVHMKARCRHVVTWQLVKNGKVVCEKRSSVFDETADIKKDEYYRLQARNEESALILFVNPVHDMQKQAEHYEFQQILSAFKHTEKERVKHDDRRKI